MSPNSATQIRFADLRNSTHKFELVPESERLAQIQSQLDLIGLRKLRFLGEIRPNGASDWMLKGRLGATVVQTCVVTGDPVTTRIEEDVTRNYLAQMPEIPPGEEIEMPENENEEPLPDVLELYDVMFEALSIALPVYPRADGASLNQSVFGPPGRDPLTDEAIKPFAGLAGLRDKLAKGDG